MSTSFGALIVALPAEFDALAFMHKVVSAEATEIPARDAQNPKSKFDHRDAESFEIGHNGRYLWIKNFDYTERFFRRNPTSVLKAMDGLDKPAEMLVVQEYDLSGAYGFALYTDGKLTRLFNAGFEEVDEEGDPLPEELPWLEGTVEEEEDDDDGQVHRTYFHKETGLSCEEEDLGLELTRTVMKARIGLLSEDIEKLNSNTRYFRLPVNTRKKKEA